jgi:hypothetical protein
VTKIPATPRELIRQIEFFEWMKRETPGVYARVVEMIEQRPERAL